MYSHLFPKEGNPILNNYRLGALEHGLKNFKVGEYLEDNTLTIIVAFYFLYPISPPSLQEKKNYILNHIPGSPLDNGHLWWAQSQNRGLYRLLPGSM